MWKSVSTAVSKGKAGKHCRGNTGKLLALQGSGTRAAKGAKNKTQPNQTTSSNTSYHLSNTFQLCNQIIDPQSFNTSIKWELWWSNHFSMVGFTDWGSALQSMDLLMEAKLSQLRKSQLSIEGSQDITCQVQFLMEASYKSSWNANVCPFISSLQLVMCSPPRGLYSLQKTDVRKHQSNVLVRKGGVFTVDFSL